MKKINFMPFFSQEKESLFNRIIATAAVTLGIMYLCIMGGMHGVQGYKLYQLYRQKNKYSTPALAFDAVVTTRSALQKSKEQLQSKMSFFRQQKRDQLIINNQLKALYDNAAHFLKMVSINDYRFNLSLETKTVLQAHQFLKELKSQPLIDKARIVHLSKREGTYEIHIKGKFKQ